MTSTLSIPPASRAPKAEGERLGIDHAPGLLLGVRDRAGGADRTGASRSLAVGGSSAQAAGSRSISAASSSLGLFTRVLTGQRVSA